MENSDIIWYINLLKGVVETEIRKQGCRNLKTTDIIEGLKNAYIKYIEESSGRLERMTKKTIFSLALKTYTNKIKEIQGIIDGKMDILLNVCNKHKTDSEYASYITYKMVDLVFNGTNDEYEDSKKVWIKYKLDNNINTNIQMGGRKAKRRKTRRKTKQKTKRKRSKSRKHF